MSCYAETALEPHEAPEGPEHTLVGWNAMLTEAQRAVQLTLDELAWLARLGAAAIDTHHPPEVDSTNNHSA